jgi:hypothetical protein
MINAIATAAPAHPGISSVGLLAGTDMKSIQDKSHLRIASLSNLHNRSSNSSSFYRNEDPS